MKMRRRSILDIIGEYMEELERVADQMFEARFIEQPSWDTASATLEPLTNVFISAKEVIITADLPCVDVKAITVKALKRDIIEIKAKTQRTISFDEFGIIHRKGKFSNFYVQVAVPVPVNTTKMKTLCKHGILEVRIPRKLGYSVQ